MLQNCEVHNFAAAQPNKIHVKNSKSRTESELVEFEKGIYSHVTVLIFRIITIKSLSFQLSELQRLRFEWYMVLVDADGKIEVSGSGMGQQFLADTVDIKQRFVQFCNRNGNAHYFLYQSSR